MVNNYDFALQYEGWEKAYVRAPLETAKLLITMGAVKPNATDFFLPLSFQWPINTV